MHEKVIEALTSVPSISKTDAATLLGKLPYYGHISGIKPVYTGLFKLV